MGGIVKSVFGGSSSKSSSSNQAYPYLQNALSGQVSTGNDANAMMAGLLGVGGNPDAAQEGYQNFLNSTGYDTVFDEAMRGVTSSAFGRGMGQSGATMKALQDRASGLGQQYFSNYLGQLGSLTGQGLQAAGIIGGAGGTSTGSGSSNTGGLGKAIGTGLSLASMFSDRRLKADVRKIGTRADGLGIYAYRYVMSSIHRVGVMADEVARLRPDALGPTLDGFSTVRYDMLEAA